MGVSCGFIFDGSFKFKINFQTRTRTALHRKRWRSWVHTRNQQLESGWEMHCLKRWLKSRWLVLKKFEIWKLRNMSYIWEVALQDNFLQTPAVWCHPQATYVDTRNVIKQWAFTGIVQGQLMKKDCKLCLRSRCTQDHNTVLQSQREELLNGEHPLQVPVVILFLLLSWQIVFYQQKGMELSFSPS